MTLNGLLKGAPQPSLRPGKTLSIDAMMQKVGFLRPGPAQIQSLVGAGDAIRFTLTGSAAGPLVDCELMGIIEKVNAAEDVLTVRLYVGQLLLKHLRTTVSFNIETQTTVDKFLLAMATHEVLQSGSTYAVHTSRIVSTTSILTEEIFPKPSMNLNQDQVVAVSVVGHVELGLESEQPSIEFCPIDHLQGFETLAMLQKEVRLGIQKVDGQTALLELRRAVFDFIKNRGKKMHCPLSPDHIVFKHLKLAEFAFLLDSASICPSGVEIKGGVAVITFEAEDDYRVLREIFDTDLALTELPGQQGSLLLRLPVRFLFDQKAPCCAVMEVGSVCRKSPTGTCLYDTADDPRSRAIRADRCVLNALKLSGYRLF